MTTTTAPITPLTAAQIRIATHLVQGLTNREIATAEHLTPGTVSGQISGLRQNLHCPPHSSRPFLAHTLLLHRLVPPPPLPEPHPPFTANENEQLLLKAIAEHSAPANIARAAKIAPGDVKCHTQDLVLAARATDPTHLVALGHTLGILGATGHGAPSRVASPEGATR